MATMDDLLAIMSALRNPEGGCPWDLQQNFSTIAPYTIEESYEVADAIDRDDMPALCDELGDLLFQVVFHAQMAREAGHFGFDDVVAAICDKMRRRHPHVFGADAAANANAVTGPEGRTVEAQLVAWEALKRAERTARGEDDRSALAGISRGLPEWQRALKLQKRAATVGFDWPDVAPVFDKLHEEIDEVRSEFATGSDPARLTDEIGDLLFVSVNLARHAKVDVSAALRHANAKFERRFRRMETLAGEAGLAALDLAAQDALWDVAKAEERSAGS
jgi:ATP diphosphatase